MTVPVRARGLRRRNLILPTGRIRSTLFPFFDGLGDVRYVLIVDEDSAQLQAFGVDDVDLSIPLFGTVGVDGRVETMDEEVLSRLAGLWHFDPWWLLRDGRFEFDETISTLQATNCVGLFAEASRGLLFSRDLRKVLRVAQSDGSFKRFRPGMLPRPEPRRQSTAGSCRQLDRGWQLVPFWSSRLGRGSADQRSGW